MKQTLTKILINLATQMSSHQLARYYNGHGDDCDLQFTHIGRKLTK